MCVELERIKVAVSHEMSCLVYEYVYRTSGLITMTMLSWCRAILHITTLQSPSKCLAHFLKTTMFFTNEK